ncbi:MAG: efflux RND transporter permease subunit [Myxococcota bacterium]
MSFTDIFIKRPVLSTVVGLVILLLGVQGFASITVREFPKMKNTVITVTTVYPGAPQDLIQGFITTPLQTAMASAEGVDYLASTSVPSQSQIQAFVELDFDPDSALVEIMSKVAQAQSQLPANATQPVIEKQTGSEVSIFYMGFYSDEMNSEQITEYLTRIVQPLFETVEGVGEVDILGATDYAMRVWLDPKEMAARRIRPDEVFQALRNNNYQAAAGQIEGYFTLASISATTTLQTAKQFEQLVVKDQGDTLIRLGDIGSVELGSQTYDTKVLVKGKPAVALKVDPAPDANPITVIDAIKAMLPEMATQMPEGLEYDVLLDQTVFIEDSIHEVIKTIWITAAIVIAVIFLFMGSVRAVIIPVVTIPLSLVGVIFFMEALGYSLNLLTLLAMVIAIGLVVDDAIVVVENVQRHIDEGKTPIDAAKLGAREIAGPVIVMTFTLAAVFAPIGFVGGLSGALFSEFAFTLAGSVVVSGIIALTLSPMMSSRFLKSGEKPKMQQWVEQTFAKVEKRYTSMLEDVLQHKPMILLLAGVVLISIPILFLNTPVELAPDEDEGIILGQGTAPMYANIDYTAQYTKEAADLFAALPENAITFSVAGSSGVNSAFIATSLKPWNQRKRGQQKIRMALQKELAGITGMEVYTFVIPPLPSNKIGLPVQFVITTQDAGYDELYKVTLDIQQKAEASGKFYFIDRSLRMNNPQITLDVKSDLAGDLGISMAEIGRALALAFGGNYVNYFDMEGRSYQVIPQFSREYRIDDDSINQIYVPTGSGKMVPLGTVVTIGKATKPNALTQYNQLNASTLNMLPYPWVSMGEAVDLLDGWAKEVFPKGYDHAYTGESRQYVQQGNTLVYAFVFAILLIFLMLAAKFESWRDPFVVMLSVPMAISGALIFMQAGATTLNIYSEIGLVTLVGLISKHGILIVEFANQLQEEGHPKGDAIAKAAAIRLRPVLMTTFAIVVAMIPLIIASGAGAASHHAIGWVIFAGMSIGTCFTLFVVPVMYSYISEDRAGTITTQGASTTPAA